MGVSHRRFQASFPARFTQPLAPPFWTRFWIVQNLKETPVNIANLKPQRCSILDTLRQVRASRMKLPVQQSEQNMRTNVRVNKQPVECRVVFKPWIFCS